MKNAIVILAIATLLSVGCSSTRQEQVTYQTLAATAVTVDAALSAYADVYVRGGISQARYQASMKTAIQVARFDLSSPTPEAVVGLARQLISLINEIL
jgi:uncharacterized protein YcfL